MFRGAGWPAGSAFGLAESWTKGEGLSHAVVWSIARDAAGRLCAGTERGLCYYDNGQGHWRLWKQDSGLASNRIVALLPDENGGLWVGNTPGGLVRLDTRAGRMRNYGRAAGIDSDRVTSLLMDSHRRLWVSTPDGLFRSTPPGEALGFEPVLAFGSAPPYFSRVLEDRQRRVWVASRRGLAVLQADVWKRFNAQDGLASNVVTRIAEAPDSSLWISYREALGIARIRLQGGQLVVQHVTTQQGLASNKVVFLASDRRGWIWVGSDNGVDVYDGRVWQHFGRNEGLVWNDCSSDAFFEDRDGSVWIGTSRGLSRLQPDRAGADGGRLIDPPVLIAEVRFGDRAPQALSSVPYEDRTFEVKFAALTFRNPSAVRFRYRLRVLEETWKETSQWEARYPGLAPGRYTFEVLARSAAGVWSRSPAHFSFRVLPPWWQSWWFRALCLMAALPVARIVWRRRQLLEVQRRLEAAVEERTRELKRAEEVLETIIRAAPVAIIALDSRQNITLWNKASERTFGWREEDVIGRPIPFLTAGRLREQTVSGAELRCPRRDGSAIDVILSTALLRDATGAVTGALLVLEDVTERRRLEAQLFQSQKLESIGRLAGGIAHDFNNLLMVIGGYTEILLQQLDESSPVYRDAVEVKSASEKATSLTQQLLAFSRKQVLQPRVLDLNAVVSDAQKMLRRLIGEDIQFTSILASAPVLVNVDPGQIHQLLMNLVVNARDAMPQGGKLVIETATLTVAAGDAELASGGYAVLTVSDTGVGMDEVAKSHLFEPFFTTKEVGRGTGLGLATVFGIVKQSGGHIQVSSEPGQGTTFRIHLPRVQENAAAGEAVEPGAGRLRGSETILLVEDQEEVRRLVGKALRSYGYRTLEAGSADDALPLARSHPGPIHLLVTDLVMPGLSGRELAHRMREERPEMKVLYISGYAEGTVVLEGAAFLQKPFTAAALAQKVREVLGLPEEAAGAGGG